MCLCSKIHCFDVKLAIVLLIANSTLIVFAINSRKVILTLTCFIKNIKKDSCEGSGSYPD